jgi:hypothetical protein
LVLLFVGFSVQKHRIPFKCFDYFFLILSPGRCAASPH